MIKRTSRLNVLALTYPGHLPEPETNSKDNLMEQDILSALTELGHSARFVGVSDSIDVVTEAIKIHQPDIIMNLLDEFNGSVLHEPNIAAYLELLEIPYTGCNSKGLVLARDKALTKKLFEFHRVPTPWFSLFPKGQKISILETIPYPVIVKSVFEESSLSISQASVVDDEKALIKRIRFLHDTTGMDVMAEAFIEGRELYVGMIGHEPLRTLPIWELIFGKKPKHTVATYQVKFNPKYQKRWKIDSQRAEGISPLTEKQIIKACQVAYRALSLSGYVRFDLRLKDDGRFYFLEANPNPDLSQEEDFGEAAKCSGLPYADLIQLILDSALEYNHSAALSTGLLKSNSKS